MLGATHVPSVRHRSNRASSSPAVDDLVRAPCRASSWSRPTGRAAMSSWDTAAPFVRSSRSATASNAHEARSTTWVGAREPGRNARTPENRADRVPRVDIMHLMRNSERGARGGRNPAPRSRSAQFDRHPWWWPARRDSVIAPSAAVRPVARPCPSSHHRRQRSVRWQASSDGRPVGRLRCVLIEASAGDRSCGRSVRCVRRRAVGGAPVRASSVGRGSWPAGSVACCSPRLLRRAQGVTRARRAERCARPRRERLFD